MAIPKIVILSLHSEAAKNVGFVMLTIFDLIVVSFVVQRPVYIPATLYSPTTIHPTRSI